MSVSQAIGKPRANHRGIPNVHGSFIPNKQKSGTASKNTEQMDVRMRPDVHSP